MSLNTNMVIGYFLLSQYGLRSLNKQVYRGTTRPSGLNMATDCKLDDWV
jgi:hypothetical protein